MKPLTISDSAAVVLLLRDQIRRSRQSRYDQRLHGVLLVAKGMTCPEVGRLLGIAPRTVEYWIQRFEERGLAGLVEGARCGRPRRLNETQLREVKALMRRAASEADASQSPRDGKSLSTWLAQRFGIHLGERQCQRMLRQFGFSPGKPHPLAASAGHGQQKTCN